ncbi:SNF2 family N-terminal domain-containing protein [Cladorrhinum sp. PSN332]|nr:SNF2 family N-terminal domain-containing protein [Cladorrhinum sp. PSN332]
MTLTPSFTGKRPYTDTEESGGPITDPDLICYGALCDTNGLWLKGVAIDHVRSATSPDGEFLAFDITMQDNNFFVQSSTGTNLAVLDTRTSSKLKTLRAMPNVSFGAILEKGSVSKRQSKARILKGPFEMSLNIHGPRDLADRVGNTLSEVKAYLQHPKHLPPNIVYRNPQFFTFPDQDEIHMTSLVGISNKPESAWAQNVKISDEISGILEELSEVDSRHQEDAVNFILQREDPSWSDAVAASISSQHGPCLSMNLGGLIADLMGLGKTLAMLTAILSSLPQARTFGYFYDPGVEQSNHFRTKATMVLVSSAQLLENWKEEVRKHFMPDMFNIVTFHGQHRPDNADALVKADLVLTTYQTLVADSHGLGLLQQMHWFRVVLDEAHWIRNSTSKQFRAASTLATQRRWCITGTPIQNKLDDLAALALFLRLPPFPDKEGFQKHILAPLSQRGPNFSKPLRAYLKAYCLRRTEKYLDLPRASNRKIELEFSPEEQTLYQRTLDQARREIDEVVSKRSGTLKKYNILFQAIVKIRMLCNHGTLPSSSTTPSQLTLPEQEVNVCEMCMTNDEDFSVLLESYSFCPDCGRSLRGSTLSPYAPSSPAGSTSSSLGGLTRDMATLTSPGCILFSTKLSGVVHNVATSNLGNKHLVFSSWTTTLDHLAQAFKNANIAVLQIDGRTSYPERSRRLKAFKEDPSVTVLLMSIETGSLGLTLTVAQNVHIVEPQWNPSVEEQAIARALRMGQTKEVTIFRYMMKNTVEQNIISLQQRKKNLARFTFDAVGDDDVNGKLEVSARPRAPSIPT